MKICGSVSKQSSFLLWYATRTPSYQSEKHVSEMQTCMQHTEKLTNEQQ